MSSTQDKIKISAATFISLWLSNDPNELQAYNVDLVTLPLHGRIKKFNNHEVEGSIVVQRGSNMSDHLELGENFKATGDISIFGSTADITIHGEISNLAFVHGSSSRQVSIGGSANNITILQSAKINNLSIGGVVSDVTNFGAINDFRFSGNCNTVFLNSHFGRVMIDSHFLIPTVAVNDLTVDEDFIIENTKIINLFISKGTKSQFNLRVSHCSIMNLTLKKMVINEGDFISFSSCLLKNVTFDSLYNLGRLVFLDIQPWVYAIDSYPTSCISFVESDLGNTQFVKCSFKSFDRFVFNNTKILDCFFSEVSYPLLDNFNQRAANVFKQQKDYFAQLKSVFQTQGKLVETGECRSREYSSYRKELRKYAKVNKTSIWSYNDGLAGLLPSGILNIFNRKYWSYDAWNNRRDRIVLWLNQHSSNYGTNWIRASFMTLMSVFVLYSIYLFIVGYRPGADISKFWELLSHSLSYLNPLRDEDTGQLFQLIHSDFKSGYLGERNAVITPLARIVDYLSRIIIAFLVFQTIAAFRRLGKSNN